MVRSANPIRAMRSYLVPELGLRELSSTSTTATLTLALPLRPWPWPGHVLLIQFPGSPQLPTPNRPYCNSPAGNTWIDHNVPLRRQRWHGPISVAPAATPLADRCGAGRAAWFVQYARIIQPHRNSRSSPRRCQSYARRACLLTRAHVILYDPGTDYTVSDSSVIVQAVTRTQRGRTEEATTPIM